MDDEANILRSEHIRLLEQHRRLSAANGDPAALATHQEELLAHLAAIRAYDLKLKASLYSHGPRMTLEAAIP